jgi:hypothetical protein
MKPRPAFLLLSLLPLVLGSPAHAWPPTYGMEFNLKSPELERAWGDRMSKFGNSYKGQAPTAEGEQRIAEGLKQKLEQACRPDCTVSVTPGKWFDEYRFRFASGFSFTLSVDPATIEMQLGPWDLETWRRYGPEIQRWLFDLPSTFGFTYRTSGFQENSAHLNIGIQSAFGKDGRAFARYLADYWQHPELGSGILGNDAYNAPLLGDLAPKQREAAKELIERAMKDSTLTPEDIAREVQSLVYVRSPRHTDGAEHYQSIGLKYVTGSRQLVGGSGGQRDRPFELRANRQPLTADQALLQLELQEKRMSYLQARGDSPLGLDLDFVVPKRSNTPPENFYDRVTAFYLYLDEMGLAGDWEKYRALLDRSAPQVEPWEFVRGRMDWSNPKLVSALERFAPRARQSESVRRVLREALALPDASRNNVGKRLIQQYPPAFGSGCTGAFGRMAAP